jgi:5-methyltetrahydropteroyltriglutamate--homocysteine methyltransferase
MLATDLSPWEKQAFRSAYKQLAEVPINIMLTTYFGGLGENLSLALDLRTAGLHIDLVRAPEQLAEVLTALAPNQTLSLGVVSGRNIWLTDFAIANRATGLPEHVLRSRDQPVRHGRPRLRDAEHWDCRP